MPGERSVYQCEQSLGCSEEETAPAGLSLQVLWKMARRNERQEERSGMAKMKHRPLKRSDEGEWAGWQLTPEEVDARMKRPPAVLGQLDPGAPGQHPGALRRHQPLLRRSAGQSIRPLPGMAAPSQYLTPEQHEADHRLMKWLEEMHHAGLKRIITKVAGTIISDDPYPDQGQFLMAIDLHVRLRGRDITRRYGKRSNDR